MERKRKLTAIIAIHLLKKAYEPLMSEDDSSDDDSENEEEMFLMSELENKLKPRKMIVPRIENYFEIVIPQFNDTEFRSHFRMGQEAFNLLNITITPILEGRYEYGRPKQGIRKKLLAFIWLLATPDSYRSVGCRFNLGKASLSDWFFRCTKALCTIAPQIIKWPNFEQQRNISNSFKRFANMENVIGAIDGTFIPIKAPMRDPEAYITRKCNYAFTLQGISEPSLKFNDAFIGYPGSVSDHRIFVNSHIFHNISRNPENYFYNNAFIIGDKAYPVLNWCIPPYINRGQLTRVKVHFNACHAKTRQVIERTFALFFGRMRRFKYLDMTCTELIPETVLAGCVLHNICLSFEDLLVAEYVREGQEFLRNNVNIEDIPENRNADGVDGILRRDLIAEELLLQFNRRNR